MNEEQRTKEWLGEPTSHDLTDLSFGQYDLSQGSTQEWWDSIKEIPMPKSELEKYSVEQLWNEIKQRAGSAIIINDAKPKIEPIAFPNFKPLVEMCVYYIKDVEMQAWADEDFKHYIYECALTCVFGDKIFDHLKKLQEG